uniref:Coiled-coil domain containing 191 n=1 Tax=Chelonoidis abingdonii TaxID=106734 RepID=A0A8C0H7E7_CHEAB
ASVRAFAMAFPAPRSQLYRWQRLTTAARPKVTEGAVSPPSMSPRVEQASRFAVSEAFSLKKSAYRQRPYGPVMDLETVEQLQDHDEAYAEAQELLSDWMNSKLRLELESDQEENVGDAAAAAADSTPVEETPAGFLKYERFDDLCSYLEQEMESTTVQDFLQNLLQNEVVDSGILEDLRIEEIKEKKKTRDPRITMELRHKQVKENCLRRQKEVELQRREKILKKLALAEAKQQVQEENKRQTLKARKEEEEIQREMVKLRKKMAEKRHIMGEAQRMKRQELEQGRIVRISTCVMKSSCSLALYTFSLQCLQQHFSAWYKFILDCRIKMGKARALADWKCQLKALRAWRDYTWVQKLEQETEQLETHLRDQNRKKQLAIEHNRKQVLRCCFIEWQLWSRAEAEKRELQLRQEEIRNKMAQLLEAASVGKLGTDGSWDVGRTRMRQVTPDQPVRQEGVKFFPIYFLIPVPPTVINHSSKSSPLNQTVSPIQWFGAPGKKVAPAFRGHFEHRHAFQQQLIEEQRRQLQEQREVILELQGNQRLRRAKQEAEQATAVTMELNNPVLKTKEKMLKRGDPSSCQSVSSLRYNHLTEPYHVLLSKMQLKAEEEERQRKEAAEKEAQLEKRQEERRQQKLKQLEKQRRLEKEQQLLAKARDHYKKVLLRKRGLEPWKRLREQAKENMVMAQKHHCSGLQRKCLLAWLWHVQESLTEKMAQAEEFSSRMLLRRGFRSWLKVSPDERGGNVTNLTNCSRTPNPTSGPTTCTHGL